MRKLVYALVLTTLPLVIAGAQTPPQLSPQDEAMQQRIISCTGESLNWQTQAISEKRRADDLQKQLDVLKKTTEAPSK